jgi:hypothetical protein
MDVSRATLLFRQANFQHEMLESLASSQILSVTFMYFHARENSEDIRFG